MNARVAAFGLAPVAVAIALALAPPASTQPEPAPSSEAHMRVNEVYPAGPGEAFVELLDVWPAGETFPAPEYAVRSYDFDGNLVAEQRYSPPYPFTLRTTPFVLGEGGDAPSLALAPGAGRVCFESGGAFAEQIHCLRYDSVPGGRSVQRQHCGKAGVAPPTRGSENTDIAGVCGRRIGCDDPRRRVGTEPKLRVLGRKAQDVDRFTVRFRLNRDGDVSTRGAVSVGNGGRSWGPVRLELRANVARRLRIPISARFVRTIKRAIRHGKPVRAFVVSVARDSYCPPNRFHSSRSYDLTN